MRRLPIILGVIAAAMFVLVNSVFIVDERNQALKLQFGQVVGQEEGYREPGLYFKIPIIQSTVYYEDRILPLETSELEVTPLDDRRLVVDAFARWRITDPVRFRQAVTNEMAALPRLERILNASLREVLGSVTSDAILSEDRSLLMQRIRDSARQSALALGVQIVDVRMRRADLPQQNLQATFQRMQAEREREAADERARGEEAAQRIRANADRQATELVSESQRESDIIRGTSDAERNRVFAEAFGRDAEFFAFYRSLSAYENAIRGENSTLVITPDSEFFEYLANDGSAVRSPAEIEADNLAPGGDADAPAEASEPADAAEAPAAPEAEAPATDAAEAPASGEADDAAAATQAAAEAAETAAAGAARPAVE